MRPTFLFASLLLLAGCGQRLQTLTWARPRGHGPCSKGFTAFAAAQLDSLRLQDPAHNAALALEQGDSAIIGIAGYALMVPGIPRDSLPWFEKRGVRVLAGTSDNVCSPAQGQLNDEGMIYAKAYNQVVRSATGPRH